MSFSVVGEMMLTTSSGPYTLSIYTDNPTITLQAQQSSTTASYAYNWLAACNNTPSARLGVEPLASEPLMVQVLGNPVSSDTAVVEIQVGRGQRLQLRLIDVHGNKLSETILSGAQAVEQHFVKLRGPTGLYLLQVSSPTQSKTV